MSTLNKPSLARASTAFLPLQSTIDTLWAKLAPSGLPKEVRRIGFTSPQADAGTTTVAACAAIGLARHMRANVLLVEANCRTPRLAEFMQVPATHGFAAVLSGDVGMEAAIQKTDIAGLSILTAGSGSHILPGFFSTEHASTVLEEFSEQYDFVLFDLPPILDSPETHSLLWRVDEACLVLRFGKTRQELATRAAAEITTSGVQLLGSILNRHKSDLPGWLKGASAA